MSLVYLNGRIVPEEQAHISVRDRGLLFGDSVFETMPVYNGRVFLLEEHLVRLERSAGLVHLALPCAAEKLAGAVVDTIAANDLTSGSVRLTVTRGVGPPGIDPLAETEKTILVTTAPKRDHRKDWLEGVDVVVSPVRRNSSHALPLEGKTGNLLNNILARHAAHQSGAFEALMLNEDGTVAEGTISNVFAVVGGVVTTPALDGRILPGVTRGAVLRLCDELGIGREERSLTVLNLIRADEVWLTNSLIEIVPVRSVGGSPIPQPWAVYEAVRQAYQQWVQRACGAGEPVR